MKKTPAKAGVYDPKNNESTNRLVKLPVFFSGKNHLPKKNFPNVESCRTGEEVVPPHSPELFPVMGNLFPITIKICTPGQQGLGIMLPHFLEVEKIEGTFHRCCDIHHSRELHAGENVLFGPRVNQGHARITLAEAMNQRETIRLKTSVNRLKVLFVILPADMLKHPDGQHSIKLACVKCPKISQNSFNR